MTLSIAYLKISVSLMKLLQFVLTLGNCNVPDLLFLLGLIPDQVDQLTFGKNPAVSQATAQHQQQNNQHKPFHLHLSVPL